MSKPAYSSFWARTLTGVVLLAAVLVAVLVSPYTFFLLLAVIMVGCMWEFYALASNSGAHPQRWMGIIAGCMIMVSLFLLHAHRDYDVVITASLAFLIPFLIFFLELFRKSETPLVNVAVTILPLLYIALPLSLLTFVAFPESFSPMKEGYESRFFLGYLFIVWANDIGAYLFGVAFGKHKMFPRLSPKKSWEGFAGGFIVAVGFAIVYGIYFGNGVAPRIHPALVWGPLSVIVVLSGVAGDFIESMFKRAAGQKDSGSIMPGHGGFLDRFDALLYSAPFVFLYFLIFA